MREKQASIVMVVDRAQQALLETASGYTILPNDGVNVCAVLNMSEPVDLLGLYLHLAQAALRRKQPQARDRLLVLAGVIAARMKIATIAAYCRHLILQHNPGHMVRRWKTLSAALDDSDFLHFLKQLQRRYPQEKAERMLAKLGIEMAHERNAYYDDEEYAAALLGIKLETLQEEFGER